MAPKQTTPQRPAAWHPADVESDGGGASRLSGVMNGAVSPRPPGESDGESPKRAPGFQRATISDVARLARVSTTAVSFVVNGRNEGIPECTRKRIQEAARQLHYRPHGLIRGLKTHRTQVVGLFLQDLMSLSSRHFSAFMAGLSHGCGATGYDMLLYKPASKPEELDASLFLDGRIDGLCFCGRPDQKALKDLGSLGFPVVALFDSDPPANVGAIWANDRRAYSTLLDRLLQEGHRRFAYCHGQLDSPIHRSRYRAFLETAQMKGIVQGQIQTFQSDADSAAREAKALFLRLGADVTAVFACDDFHAAALAECAEKTGRGTPEGVSLIGYDNMGPATLRRPLATTKTPIYEIGVQVVSQLDAMIQGESREAARICLPVEVIEGETIGPAPRRRVRK